MIQLEKSINLFKYCSVLNYDNELVSLWDNIVYYEWGDIIGFNIYLKELLLVPNESCRKAKVFDSFSITTTDDSCLKEYNTPKYGDLYPNINPNTNMSIFSIIDFNVIPIQCYASIILQNYISARLGYEDSKDQSDLIKITVKVHKYNKPVLKLEKVLLQIDTWSSQDVFLPLRGSALEHEEYYIMQKSSAYAIINKTISNI